MFSIKEIKQETEIAEWIYGHNISFKGRSNKRIPYSPLQRMELDLDKDVVLAHYSDEKMVGGCYIAFMQGRVKLKHVWVLPEERRNGIAERMIHYSEDIALKHNIAALYLDVADIYKPAVNLYTKLGYQKYSVFANAPGTYCFYRMVKPSKIAFSYQIRIKAHWLVSLIKFSMLFYRDSTPKRLCKVIYNGKKQ